MNAKLKILMIAATPMPGNRGTPSRILDMAEALHELGHQVKIVSYHLKSRNYNGPVEIIRIPNIITYNKLGPGPSLQKFLICDVFLYSKVKQIINKFKPDIVHGHSFEGALIALMLKKHSKAKTIYDAHSTLIGEMPHYNFFSPKKILNFIDSYVPKKSDYVISVSESIKHFLTNRNISEDRISVIPTGVNINQFTGFSGDVFREKYHLYDQPIVTYTGTLANFQGTEYFVKSIQGIVKKIPNTMAVIVGNDSTGYYKNLMKQLGIQENVLLLEDIPFSQVPEILAASDVVVSPRIECPGIPQKLTNYMAAGKAIVSFEGSAKLIQNKRNGIIVENGNIEKFSNAVVEVLNDKQLRENLEIESFNTIKGTYEWHVLAKKIENIYYKLVQGKK